jgi:hypothetical protein
LTHEWWNKHRQEYELCVSKIVLDEAADGDTDAAQRRMVYLEELPLLELTEDVDVVALAIMGSGLLPPAAARDAIHIAVSSVHSIDILLTWNCRHIANATIRRDLEEIVANSGFRLPILSTPEELVGD